MKFYHTHFLPNGDKVFLSLCDVWVLKEHNIYSDEKGYIRCYKKGTVNKTNRGIRLHRFLLGITDPKIQVDHRNWNKRDNRRSNLRLCTNSQNKANSVRSKNNSSGFKGVHFEGSSGKWIARIGCNKVRIFIGRFVSAELAAKAYNKKAKQVFGEFAALNKEKGI